MNKTPPFRSSVAVEWFAAVLVLVCLGWDLWRLHIDGYLPEPYFVDPSDSLMDGVNTAWWSHHKSPYLEWNSIYPPLSFVFDRLVTLPHCAELNAQYMRDCDWLFKGTLVFFWILTGLICLKSYWTFDRQTAIPRTIILTFGLPLTFALERGNLIIPCFMFFALGNGPVLRWAWARWLSAAMSANFKPYLLAPILTNIFKYRWRVLEGSLIAVVLVYLVTWLLQGEGSPWMLYQNITSFAGDKDRAASWPFVYYATSYDAMLQFMDSRFPLMAMVGSRPLELTEYLAPVLIRTGQVMVIAAFLATMIEPNAVPQRRLSALGVLAVIITTDPGGYTQVFAFYLILFEPWKGVLRITALICIFALSLAYEYNVAWLGPWTLFSYWAGTDATTLYGVGIGPFVRPALLLICCYAMSSLTLIEVVQFRRRRLAQVHGAHEVTS